MVCVSHDACSVWRTTTSLIYQCSLCVVVLKYWTCKCGDPFPAVVLAHYQRYTPLVKREKLEILFTWPYTGAITGLRNQIPRSPLLYKTGIWILTFCTAFFQVLEKKNRMWGTDQSATGSAINIGGWAQAWPAWKANNWLVCTCWMNLEMVIMLVQCSPLNSNPLTTNFPLIQTFSKSPHNVSTYKGVHCNSNIDWICEFELSGLLFARLYTVFHWLVSMHVVW